METSGRSMGALGTKVKQASLLWFEGFREACCLHRVVIYCFRSRQLMIRTGQCFLCNLSLSLSLCKPKSRLQLYAFWFYHLFSKFLIIIVCNFHRRSRQLMIRTGQCFLLNGLIFLGSIIILNSVVIPTLQWILPSQCEQITTQQLCSFGIIMRLYSLLHHVLLQLFYVLWFYPLYILSFILSNMWYNDIAKYGFGAIETCDTTVTEPSSEKEISPSRSTSHMDKPIDFGGVVIGIAEQVYSVLLLNFFFLEVYVTGFIPYVGKAFNFLLLSWMYAYYCFEYKWNFTGLSLDKRLDFFESNWAFFAGFGNPCILAVFFFSPLVSYGLLAILFPLFVLTATGSDADKVIVSRRNKWGGGGLGRLPIFYVANSLSMRILSLLPSESQEQKQDDKAL